MFWRMMVIVGFTSIAVSCAPASESAHAGAAPAEVFSVVAGRWGWVEGTHTCESNPHTISFSPDWRFMYFLYPEPVDTSTGRREATYEVRGYTPYSIRAFLLHETRTDRMGELVEWDLILLSKDLYVWRQSDWPIDASTNPLERCSD